MAKKVHMIKGEPRKVPAFRDSYGGLVRAGRTVADTVCGNTTRSMRNATYNIREVTCHYCLGRLNSKVNG